MVRDGAPAAAVLQSFSQAVAEDLAVRRCVVWIIGPVLADSRLEIAAEFFAGEGERFRGTKLSAVESTATMLELLSSFPDNSGDGLFHLPGIGGQLDKSKKWPVQHSMLEAEKVRKRIVGQLRSHGVLFGFVDLWITDDAKFLEDADREALEQVILALSVSMQCMNAIEFLKTKKD